MTSFFFVLSILLAGSAVVLARRVRLLESRAAEILRQKEMTLALLDRVGESLTTRLEIDPALEIIADYVVEATEADAGAIFILDKDGRFLTARVVLGMFPPLHETLGYVLTKRRYVAEKVKADRIALGEGIIGLAAQSTQPILITDCRNDPRVPKVANDFLSMNSLMAAPLRTRGASLGVLAVVNKRGGATFSEKDMELLQSLADQAALTVDLARLLDEEAERQRTEQELRLAREFQTMLLPEKCPQAPGFDLAAYSNPAREVGGDFYDFIPLDESRLGVAIADVSGKGIPGALVMAMARTALRAEARLSGSPREALKRLNERMVEDTKENVFITMTYGILDFAKREFRFARAGHEPALSGQPGGGALKESAPSGIALGLVGAELFDVIEEERIALPPGWRVILYTDGAVEAMDEGHEEYGRERLLANLQRGLGQTSRQIVNDVVEDIGRFTRGQPQHDDITLVAIRALDPGEEQAPDVREGGVEPPAAMAG